MKKILLLSLIVLGFTLGAKASHLMGADISYQYLYSDATDDYYQVTLTLYRDCGGVSVGAAQTVRMNSGSGCGTAFTQSLPLVGTATEVSPLCPSQLSNSTCNGGTIIGVEQYIFQDIVGFPTKCNDWNISFYQCCRNNGGAVPHNLVSPASYDLYVESELNNTGSLNNNSPQFTSLPVPYICAGQPFTYNHGAFDPDGDSIVYEMIPAQDGPYPGTNLAYNAPATAAAPIVGAANVFDSQTGSIWVNPDGSDELAVMAVIVREYRNGVLIGTTMRDIQVVVQSCSNVQPQDGGPNGGFDVVTGDGAIVDSNSIEVCPNGYVEFEVVYEDQNATDDITLMTNIATVIPGATFTQSGTNPATGVFTWTPTTADVGFHNFTITVQDDGCPILGSQVFAFDIDVLTRTYTEPDQAYCASGGALDISASGGSVFTWTTLSGDGLGCTSCATTTGAPTTTGTYEVTSDLSGTCKNKDTVTITRVPDVALSMSSDPTICKYGSAAISVTASPGAEAPFTYSWAGDSLSSTTISGPTANPLVTTTYPVIVTSDAGCRMIDSVTVIVSGVAPNVLTAASADSLCQGDAVNLSSTIRPDGCSITTDACSGTQATYDIGTGTSSTTTYGPFYLSTVTAYSNRRQYMYTAAQLIQAGMPANGGKIDQLGLNLTTDNTTINGVRISMGCTSMDQFPDANFESGLTQVKNSFNWNPAGTGWSMINLDNDYMWDGVSNLIVEICMDNSMTGTGSSVQYTCIASEYLCLYRYFAGNSGCSQPTALRTTCRPNMRFRACEAVPAGITYSWSPSGGSSDVATVTPSTTTTYTLTATDGSCDGTSAVTVLVGPSFNLNTTADNTICAGGSMNLNTSPSTGGSYTYQWTPTVFNTLPSSATTTVNPPANMMYYTTVSNGICRRYDSVQVTVGGQAFTALLDGDSVCAGDPVQLDMTTSPVTCGVDYGGCQGTPNTYQLGVAASATYSYGPFYRNTSYTDSKYQYIITAAELTSAGYTAGTISELAINVTTKNTILPYDNVRIAMGCTNLDVYPVSGYAYEPTTEVYSPREWTSAMGWNTFTLDYGFGWDGVSNLVVDFCYNNASTDSYDYFQYSSLLNPNYQTIRGYATSGDGCALPPTARYYYRPNMQITICDPATIPGGATYSWSPSATVASPTNSATDAYPTTTTTYTLSIDDGSCVSTADITVQASAAYNLNTTADNVVCAGDSYNMNTSPSTGGSYTYEWSPSSTLSSTNTASTTATPLGSTNYVVRVVKGFCVRYDTIAVGVSGHAVNAVPDEDTLCQGETLSLDVNSAPLACGPSTTGCAGTPYSYRFNHGVSNTYSYGPFYRNTSYRASKYEYILTAAELTGLGFSAGTITGVSVTVNTKNTTAPYEDVYIRMGCTNLDVYPTTGYAYEATTQVYGPHDFSTAIGKNTFVFDTPFDWDGTSNLVMSFCYSNSVVDSYDYFEYGSLLNPNYRTIRGYSLTAGANGCTLAPTARYYYRPNFEFDFCMPPAAPSTVTWSGEALSSTTNPSTTAQPTQSGTYTVDINVAGCPTSASTDIVIDSSAYVAASANASIACNGDVVNLGSTATGTPAPGVYSSCGANGSACSWGSTVQQIGTATSGTYSYGPFYHNTSYFDSRMQYIITAQELTDAGFTSGALNALQLNIPVTNNLTGALNNVRVKLGCTALTEYPSTGYAFLGTSATVYSGSLNLHTAGLGWYTINFTSSFDWDGTSNIVLEFCYNNSASVSYAYYEYSPTTYYRTLRQYATTGTTCNLTTTVYRNNYRPNFRFTMCTPPPQTFSYSWSPSTGLSNPNIANPSYTSDGSGETYTVTVTGGNCIVFDSVTVNPCFLANENVILDGEQVGTHNVLNWNSTLTNVKTYIVERRSASGQYVSVGEVIQKGEKYSLIDYDPQSGVNRYRVRCLMNNDVDQYSNFVEIDHINDNVTVYPNPSNSSSSIFISFESETDQVSIEMIDLLGQEVISNTTIIQGGQSKVELDVSKMPSGTYIYKVNIEGRVTIGKLVLNN